MVLANVAAESGAGYPTDEAKQHAKLSMPLPHRALQLTFGLIGCYGALIPTD